MRSTLIALAGLAMFVSLLPSSPAAQQQADPGVQVGVPAGRGGRAADARTRPERRAAATGAA